MCDIIESMPWSCGDNDCPVGWHIANYWVNEDGTYSVDNYSDGDHDEIDRPPTSSDVTGAWVEYWTDVLRTGEDPLCQVRSRTVDNTRRWQIRISNSILGPCLHSVRPATKDGDRFHGRGTWLYRSDIPAHVAEYLLFNRNERSDRPWEIAPEYQHKNDRHGFERYIEVVRGVANTGDEVTEPRPSPRITGVHFFVLVNHKVTLPPTANAVRRVARSSIKELKREIAR